MPENDPAAPPEQAATQPPEPVASEASAAPAPRRKRGWATKLLKRALVRLAVAVLPRLYVMYMWLVYATSRHEHRGCTPAVLRERYGKGIFVLWHEEVVFVAYAFKQWYGSTLASHGDAGELITRMLELCNFTVFRGGSSRGRRRRAADVLDDMVEYMNRNHGVIYGITVDGSTGPVYRMKNGAAKIAVRCQAPIGLEKTWCKRYFRLRTWDQTIVPLPFNHIIHLYAGPYIPPPPGADRTERNAYAKRVEADLALLSCHARYEIEGEPPPAEWLARFPEHLRAGLPLDGGEIELEQEYRPVALVPETELGMRPPAAPEPASPAGSEPRPAAAEATSTTS